MRSRAAAAVLAGAGFRNAASLEGGIAAWNGLVASGPPEAGMAHFAAATRPDELVALAWYLEAGMRAFYAAILASTAEAASAALYGRLAGAEEHHMAQLRELHARLPGARPAPDFPQGVVPQEWPDAVMEGGVEVARALEWARGRTPMDVLEYCIALETNSYDLYLRMLAATPDPEARRVFDLLSAEERRHLELLAARFEQLAAEGAA